MLTPWVILSLSAAYLLLLFAVAYWGDRRAVAGRSVISNGVVYSLSLAVFVSSWTFYGSVGRAASTGVGFLPVYLGPTLMVALWWLVLRKIIRICRRNRITSLADFVSARYGKSALLGGLVSVIAVVGIVPYIALQLKAISNTYDVLQSGPLVNTAHLQQGVFWQDTAFYAALLLAVFSIVFGTRHLDATERHEGMVAAIAVEAVVKLFAFLTVGIFVTFGLFSGPADLTSKAAEVPRLAALFDFTSGYSYSSWVWMTLLSMVAIVFLPRQFQVAVVENVDERHLNTAAWLFPLYLFLINLFVLPIAMAGALRPGGVADPDVYVLSLPMADGQEALALLAFLGGLSAATGMVVVETIALSTMVSNSLVMPVLLARGSRLVSRPQLGGVVLGIRRVTILGVLLLGYVYFRVAGQGTALVSIGLVSFAAVAQFAPPVLIGLYWKGATRNGAVAGLSCGFGVWLYTLVVPNLVASGLLPRSLLDGPFGIELFRPQHLFGMTGMDVVSHSMFWSMLVNIGCLVLISLNSRPGVGEQGQAVIFVDVFRRPREGAHARFWRGSVSVGELEALLERFLGTERTREVLAGYADEGGIELHSDLQAEPELVHHVETVLAGAVGAAAARIMVGSVVEEEPLALGEVMTILDEASQMRSYSRELERKSRELEVATGELRAANERLQELDRLKDDFVSTVSHELRTPLTSIRAFSEILLDNPELAVAGRARYLTIVVEEAERLTRLIKQVLDLAKLESGRIDWDITAVDLREVVEDSVQATAGLFGERAVDLAVEVPASVPPVAADRDRLVQVLVNLLSNAAKFGSGRVAVSLSVDQEAVRVDVQDNGPGISRREQKVIFEKFRQGGDVLTSRPQGTGLGLPISRQIVERLGGQLWLDSAPGEGATFSFQFPPVRAEEPAGRKATV